MRHEVVQTLSRLVKMPTVSHRPVVEIAAYLAQRAEDVGFEIHRFETEPGKVNVVAIAGPPEGGGLALSGHMDVVPVDDQAWTSDPFVLREADDRLHGRGTCDMKGFIAAVTEAMSPALVSSLRQPLALIWTHDEEVGCLGSAALIEQVEALERPLPDLAWIGEPTSFQVCNLHPGHCRVDIRCTGRPAHSSRPELGLSAITMAAEVCLSLQQLQETLRHERAFEAQLQSPFTILNIAEIHGGTAINIIPEHCHVQVGARPLPGQTGRDILERIRSAIAPIQLRAQAEGGSVELSLGAGTPSLHTHSSCSLMPTLLAHASSPHATGVPFATDGGNLSRLGMETLVFGPGSIDQAHRADEFIPAAELFRTVTLVEGVVRSRCGV